MNNDPASLVPSAELRSSSSSVLTALTQLGLLRLNASRALISLFDRSSQHIVAEATSELPLRPSQPCAVEEPLWLSGTAIPRSFGICEHVLFCPPLEQPDDASQQAPALSAGGLLPVSVIDDLADDPRFADRPFVSWQWPRHRFYAGVPIRTQQGINIGVFCIFGNEPRQGLSPEATGLMQDLSATIMDHLEMRLSDNEYRRTHSMVRGIGSFVQGAPDMIGRKEKRNPGSTFPTWRREHTEREKDKKPPSTQAVKFATELPLRSVQQSPEQPAVMKAVEEQVKSVHSSCAADHAPTLPAIAKPANALFHDHEDSQAGPVVKGEGDERKTRIHNVFFNAATTVRESIDVQGVAFLEAKVSSDQANLSIKRLDMSTTAAVSSSNNEAPSRSDAAGDNDATGACCTVLGHSSESPSIEAASLNYLKPPETFLRRLLRRYPRGKIFNFDEAGMHSSESSGEEAILAGRGEMEAEDVEAGEESPKPVSRQTLRKQAEHKILISMFTGARSIAFVPVWDAQHGRWFAGSFAFTTKPSRILTAEGELSYLFAFGTVVMAEVSRLETTLANKSKMDILSSLSHELRSPLHGVVLGLEMLHDSPIDAFQRDVLLTVEACGRTLLDTVDHLLDWTKINNFMAAKSVGHGENIDRDNDRVPRARGRLGPTIETPLMSIDANVDIDALAEEVVESMLAAHTFQELSIAHFTRSAGKTLDGHARSALRRLDGMHATMDKGVIDPSSLEHGTAPGEILVSLDIEPAASWLFHTQAGALRRIIMNLLGNSLKYTTSGFIRVTLGQRQGQPSSPPTPGRRRVRRAGRTLCITIADSGRGISEDYLRNYLFVPFSQEDRLNSGVGLGLSLVKKIVSTMGGRVQLQSQLGRGTVVSVELPLEDPTPGTPQSPAPQAFERSNTALRNEFQGQVNSLRGRRVRLVGFSKDNLQWSGDEAREKGDISQADEYSVVASICEQWLQMHVVDHENLETAPPDIIICNETSAKSFEESDLDSAPPVVVVCRNMAVAREMESIPATSGRTRRKRQDCLMEYTCRPYVTRVSYDSVHLH